MSKATMAKRVFDALRKVAGWVLVGFGVLILVLISTAFVQGNLPAGITGLVISTALVWIGCWLLQRPKRLITLHNRIFKGGPYLQGRDLRIPYLIGTIPFLIFITVLIASSGAYPAVFYVIVFFIIPLLTWYLLTGRAAKWVLSTFIQNPNPHNFVTRLVKSHQRASEYFFDSITRAQPIWRRVARVVIFSLALPAAIVSLMNVSPTTEFNAFAEFLLLVVLTFSGPSLLYAVLWVYEDSGLRYYDSTGALVDVPLTRLVDFVSGIVGLTTIIRFLQLITSNLFQASSIGFGLFFALGSPILLALTIFQHMLESDIVKEFRESKIVTAKRITLTP